MSTLGRAAKSMASSSVELQVEADELELPIEVAPSLALILNELLTNVLRYDERCSEADLRRIGPQMGTS